MYAAIAAALTNIPRDNTKALISFSILVLIIGFRMAIHSACKV